MSDAGGQTRTDFGEDVLRAALTGGGLDADGI